MSLRSPLAAFAHLSQEPDPARAFDAQRKAWIDHGIVCLSLEQAEALIGWVGARQLRSIGEQVFGKR